ncbi:hypothetical protein MTR67_008428 [Solanum verrucosum]|uniref:Integrase catalytic domain-containing protein n=1 Tax=Solanum verrucosum TaxID=315347 RepID=A0AAF0Q1Y5_SOLVR|nr:hypothetical protein MTR67_008428 [Solanum verrucosum]
MVRIRKDFYWPTMKTTIKDYVAACSVCQRNKAVNLTPEGLLQPLQLPNQIWSDISMDFIDGLPKSGGKTMLFVVVDRFSKYAHFIPLAHPYNASSVARIFFENIVRLHGIPESIVSDRDAIFTSSFWKELFRLCGTKLHFSSAYHPQSDGQTEVVNRMIEMYFQCLDIRAKLQQAQHKMKIVYDKGHRDVEFSPGSYVWLWVHPYRQKAQASRVYHKLAPRYYGPFAVLRRIGSVAYQLGLPAGCKLHDVFHVSLLKSFKGEVPATPPSLPPVQEGHVVPTPCSVLRSRLNRAIIGKSRNKNRGLDLSIGPDFSVNRPATQSRTRDLNTLQKLILKSRKSRLMWIICQPEGTSLSLNC